MAAQYEFTNAQVRSIVNGYTKKNQGLATLAEEWQVSISVIRRLLEEQGVTLRGRGRPVGS